MEPAGVAIGIAGLAGLYSSVLEVVNTYYTYKTFAVDSDALHARFEAERIRFQLWGHATKLDGPQLSFEHSADLGLNQRQYAAVENLLRVLYRILEGEDDRQISHDSVGDSMRHKLKWAMRGKKERKEQVEMFGILVQNLYDLVPLRNAQLGSEPQQGADSSSISGLDDVVQILTRVEAERKLERHREVRSWILGKEALSERYQDSLQRRLTGTCDWIFDKPDFQSWLSRDSSATSPKLLWINGHAGFGKTILCARLVEHLSFNTNHPVAHFFFSSDYTSRDDPYIVMRSWLVQLISSHAQAFDVAYSEFDEQDIAPRAKIALLLKQVLTIIRDCILVIDGLDECTALRGFPMEFERFIGGLTSALAPDTRLLLVSRDELEIRGALTSLQGLSEIKITAHDVAADTEALSQNIVNAKLPNKSQETRKDLAGKMRDRCDGQFLWLVLQEISLRKGMTKKDLEMAINHTPSRLGLIYDRNWDRIAGLRSWDRNRAFSVLRWATFAVQPLTAGQLAEAMLIDGDCDEFPAEDVPDDMEAYVESEILGLCSPLIEVFKASPQQPPESQTIQLAHFSVREYLLAHLPVRNLGSNDSLRLSNEARHHAWLAQLCLRYIRSPNVWDEQLRGLAPAFRASFRDYAADEWYAHLSLGGVYADTCLSNLTLEFMDERFPTWHSWRSWFDQKESETWDRAREKGLPGPLYYAVNTGLTAVALRMLRMRGHDVRVVPAQARSALHLASADGHVLLVEAMLDAGFDTETLDPFGRTALHVAAGHGRTAVARLLMAKGASMTSVSPTTGALPIHIAAVGGHAQVVGAFLERGFDISADESGTYTESRRFLTHLAAYTNAVDILRVLIQYGADISLRDEDGLAPLHAAAARGHSEITNILLEGGADINARTRAGETPHHLAAEEGHLTTASILLERGADINATTGSGETALGLAAYEGHYDVVMHLLQQGANVEGVNANGWTILHESALADDADMVQLLLGDGRISINSKDNNGRTPLILAAGDGRYNAVETLLADPRISTHEHDYWGNTPLIAAARNGHSEVLGLLLDASGSDVREGFGHPLLWWLQRGTSPDVIRLLGDGAANGKFEGFSINPRSVVLEVGATNCDVCTVHVLSEFCYHCHECDGGDFDICFVCYTLGFRCREPSHTGTLRKVEDYS